MFSLSKAPVVVFVEHRLVTLTLASMDVLKLPGPSMATPPRTALKWRVPIAEMALLNSGVAMRLLTYVTALGLRPVLSR